MLTPVLINSMLRKRQSNILDILPSIVAPDEINGLYFWTDKRSINNFILNSNFNDSDFYLAYVNGGDNQLPTLLFENNQVKVTPNQNSAFFGFRQIVSNLTVGTYTFKFDAKSTVSSQNLNVLGNGISQNIVLSDEYQTFNLTVNVTTNLSSYFIRSNQDFEFFVRNLTMTKDVPMIERLSSIIGNRAFTQSTVSSMPTVDNNTIRFDGTQSMIVDNTVANMIASQDSTVLILAKIGDVNTNSQRLFTVQNNVSSSRFNFEFITTDDHYESVYNNTSNGGSRLLSNIVVNDTTYFSLTRVNSGTNAKFIIDNTLQDEANDLSTFTNGDAFLSGYNSAQFLWNGNIREIIIYNRALTAQELANINNYLNNKYS